MQEGGPKNKSVESRPEVTGANKPPTLQYTKPKSLPSSHPHWKDRHAKARKAAGHNANEKAPRGPDTLPRYMRAPECPRRPCSLMRALFVAVLSLAAARGAHGASFGWSTALNFPVRYTDRH